jgi:hypothetical protein
MMDIKEYNESVVKYMMNIILDIKQDKLDCVLAKREESGKTWKFTAIFNYKDNYEKIT